MADQSTAYITTPIYYVNDKPHIGHVYTTTICDVWARFMRFAGKDVFFLTGTDEHGIKVEKSAKERGISPQALADENAAEFQRVLGDFDLTNDDFIRTTADYHHRQVQEFVRKLLESEAVYLGDFEGWYDEGQEEYYTETKARELDYTSPVSGRPLVIAKEKNYYFRLSAYQDRMEKLFEEQPDFVRPEARRNEVLGRLREGLADVPMSRTNFTWGIPMPNDPEHVIYVWIEALMNYATALGLGEIGGERYSQRAQYWPATFHVIGKEILWFHAVIWPAVLMTLELPLPKCIYAHSFWISEGQKMSKSLGNFIDLAAIDRYIAAYGLDSCRYFLTTQGPLGATDADFSANHFHDIYSTDLVNTVGNCASRVTAMINKYYGGAVPSESTADNRLRIADHDWPEIARRTVGQVGAAMDRFDLAGAVATALGLIRKVDGFINRTEPFKLAKDEPKSAELGAILYQCLEAVRIASLLLWPVMPRKMAELWQALGLQIDPDDGGLNELAAWGGIQPGITVIKVALFPRMEQPELTTGANA
ncbi:MAG: methionine--tRNA ligase [Phycisphaerales bacterium]|nr:MAG: methionine--tRNA ligase [Phycisphaerales bacterium]